MLTYDDASTAYDKINIGYDGATLISYHFYDAINKSESVSKSAHFTRVFTETLSKAESIKKGIGKFLSEISGRSDTMSQIQALSYSKSEILSKTEKLKILINGVIPFFNKTKPTSTWTNKTK